MYGTFKSESIDISTDSFHNRNFDGNIVENNENGECIIKCHYPIVYISRWSRTPSTQYRFGKNNSL